MADGTDTLTAENLRTTDNEEPFAQTQHCHRLRRSPWVTEATRAGRLLRSQIEKTAVVDRRNMIVQENRRHSRNSSATRAWKDKSERHEEAEMPCLWVRTRTREVGFPQQCLAVFPLPTMELCETLREFRIGRFLKLCVARGHLTHAAQVFATPASAS